MVTISILNYQRRDTLRLALERALAQRYPRLEIIVVDNCSTDGSDRMVEDEFPGVRLLRLPENVGCAARNAGVAAAKGEIVLTIDNDVLLTSPDAVGATVALFRQHPGVACINFKILYGDGTLSKRDWCHPRDWRTSADCEFLTDYVLEGASAHRREVFDAVGGYWPPLFIGHEGFDLALRLLDAGHDLLYAPQIGAIHLTSPEARPSSRIYYTFTRNGLWIAARHLPWWRAAVAVGRNLGLMGFCAVRAGEVGAFARGVSDAMRGRRLALGSRRPLARNTFRRIRHIRALAPSIVQRVMRHLWERLI